MNILINGVLVAEPDNLISEWVTVAVDDLVYRQVKLTWEKPTPAQAAVILTAATAANTSISYLNPVNNANITLPVKIYAAQITVLREASGAVYYSPLSLTLREVIP